MPGFHQADDPNFSGKANGQRARQAARGRQFEVRSGVPMPTTSAYPFERMKVGQMFEIPKDLNPAKVRSAAGNFCARRRHQFKFAILRIAPDQFGCWRVK